MDAKAKFKAKLPSRQSIGEVEPARGRAFYCATGPIISQTRWVFADMAEVLRRIPYVKDLKRGGRHVAKDLFEASGVPLVMKILVKHGFRHGEYMTVRRTMAENLNRVKWNRDRDPVVPANRSLLATEGVAGNLSTYAEQLGVVLTDAVIRPGAAAEKKCYAYI